MPCRAPRMQTIHPPGATVRQPAKSLPGITITLQTTPRSPDVTGKTADPTRHRPEEPRTNPDKPYKHKGLPMVYWSDQLCARNCCQLSNSWHSIRLALGKVCVFSKIARATELNHQLYCREPFPQRPQVLAHCLERKHHGMVRLLYCRTASVSRALPSPSSNAPHRGIRPVW
jgi:hypothetical protein